MASEPTLLKIELPCSLFLVNSIQEFREHKRIALRRGLQRSISDGVSEVRSASPSDVRKVDYFHWAETFLASWQFRNRPRTFLVLRNPASSDSCLQPTFLFIEDPLKITYV
jgi:hypothetical protein